MNHQKESHFALMLWETDKNGSKTTRAAAEAQTCSAHAALSLEVLNSLRIFEIAAAMSLESLTSKIRFAFPHVLPYRWVTSSSTGPALCVAN